MNKIKSLFIALWALCLLGSWSVLPYASYLGVLPPGESFSKLFLLATAQSVVFFGVIIVLSYLLIRKTDLAPFSMDGWLRRIVYPGLIAGGAVGAVIILFERFVFQSSPIAESPPAWAGFLASFYGAINEEVLLRLFLLTFLYFLLGKIVRFQKKNREAFLWIATVIAALLFGFGHLPAAFQIGSPTGFDVFRILLLNGIGGIVFGWLYWSRSFWAAMAAHFVADLILHVFMI